MKEALIKILGSILKAIAISALFASGAYLAGINVLMTFIISFTAQFIIFYLYNSYLELKAAKILRESRLKELELLSRITFTINCAACKQPNEVVINASIDNIFDCQHCKAKNSAYITAEAAVVTTPIATRL